MIYPIVSNSVHDKNKNEVLKNYEEIIDNASNEKIKEEREKAKRYNETLMNDVVMADSEVQEEIDYFDTLNLNNNEIMGYISIPKIDVKLPIYHGTSEDVLKNGVGHLEGTSLPIGGEGTHSALTGHTGLPNAKLFTDLDKIEVGDIFYLDILDEKMAYEVDQIKIVEPQDTSDLAIDPTKDYVTLVTCTPYGINSHRLLVRGTRVPYTEDVEEEINKQEKEKAGSTWRDEYFKALLVGLGGLAILGTSIFIIAILIKKKKIGILMESNLNVDINIITEGAGTEEEENYKLEKVYDYSIGDNVIFRVEADIPKNIAKLATYKIEFEFAPGIGPNFGGYIKVYGVKGDGTKVVLNKAKLKEGSATEFTSDSDYTYSGVIRYDVPSKVEFTFLRRGALVDYTQIYIEFETILNSSLVVSDLGNPSNAYMKYSKSKSNKNDPNTPDKIYENSKGENVIGANELDTDLKKVVSEVPARIYMKIQT